MTIYTRPDTYAEEVPQIEGPIQAAQVGIGGLQGVTKKGPVGVPIRTRSYAAWERIFGGREVASRGDVAYEAKAFFDEGGFELITVRQVHFSDIDDKTSYTGGVATNTSITDGVAATSAYKRGGIGPYELAASQTVIIDVDNVSPVTSTFTATAGYVDDSTGYPVADQTGKTLILSFDGGSNQTVTFGTATSAAQLIEDINQQIYGGKAEDNGGQIRITSDREGSGSSVVIVGGTHGLTFGAPTSGTGNVSNIRAVTAAEVKTIVELATTALVTVNADSSFTVTSPTTGIASELDFQASTALTALGLSIEVIVGTALGATYSTLKLEAGYHGTVSPGLEGNNLKKKITQNPLHASLGAGNDLAGAITALDTYVQLTSLKGLNAGSVIKVWDGTYTEYFEVTQVRSVVSGGAVTFFVDIDGAFVNSFAVISTQVQSQEFDIEIYNGLTLVETHTALSMLDTVDNYVETILNDENLGSEYLVATDLDADPPGIGADVPATDSVSVALASGTDETIGLVDADWIGTETGGTGLYGWDLVREFMSFATPGNNSAAMVHAASAYAFNRMFMEYVTYIDTAMTATDAVAYRDNVLGLDSSYVSLYAGGMKVFDPLGSGSSPSRLISGVGGLLGLRARVDSMPDPTGGPWQSPAGEGAYGTLRSALNVATDYNDSDAGILNSAGINAIRKFGVTSPVLVWGSRTLDSTVAGRFRYINVRRFFQYVEKSVIDSTRWGVHRNNDFRLWSSLKDRVDAWLTNLMTRRAFPSVEKATAFFVKMGIDDGTMTQSDVDNGRCIGQIGLAPNKPAEFIIFQFSQLDSGYEITE